MKLKLQNLMDATLILRAIISQQRPMPLKGKYRVSRMFAKLAPEFDRINAERDDLIRSYNTHQKIRVPMSKEESAAVLAANPDEGVIDLFKEIDGPEFVVPPEKTEEFHAAMAERMSADIEIDVEPIPLAMLDLGDDVDGAIEANELQALGDLVTE